MTWRTHVARHSLALLVLLAGCGRGHYPVEPEHARDALRQTLDAWKSGLTLEGWKKREPSLTVQEPDWQAGLALAGFEILDQGDENGANLRCRVRLLLRDAAGKEFARETRYIVTTRPTRTVFRDLM